MVFAGNSPIENARDLLNNVQSFDTSTLLKIGGPNNHINSLTNEPYLAPAIPYANKIVELFNKINPSILEDLPDKKLEFISKSAGETIQAFNEILAENNIKSSRINVSSITQNLNQIYNSIFDNILLIASLSALHSADISTLKSKYNDIFTTARNRIHEIELRSEELQHRGEKALDAVQKAAEQQGVSQQANFFLREAVKYDKAANRWLIGSFTSTFFLFLIITLLIFYGELIMPKDASTYQFIQFNVTRAILIGVLIYILFFCSKNYFSAKHNATINHHRTTALQSYEALALAAKDTANTDIILNHAAACVFTPQNTGYSGSKADGNLPGAGSPPSLILKASAGSKD